MPKRLELISELVPQAKLIALLVNPNNPNAERNIRDVQEAARAKGAAAPYPEGRHGKRDRHRLRSPRPNCTPARFSSAPTHSSSADATSWWRWRHAMPFRRYISWREFAAAGGLMSYGPSYTAAYRQVGIYAGKILKGAKPADLPVQQPTTFELVINLNTAKALGLTVPHSILARADEVIE